MKHLRKIKSALGKDISIEKALKKKARPGAWKTLLKPNPSEEKINKHTEIPPVVQEQMIVDVANGVPPVEIETKYGVARGYVRSVMLRRFGSLEMMKKALTLQCYENAMAFMEYGAEKIGEMTAGQAILAGKLSVDAGAALEKTTHDKPETIDFATLQMLGAAIGRIEKQVEGTDRTLPAPAII